MREAIERPAAETARPSAASAEPARPLVIEWREGLAIVNLRGDPLDPAFRAAVLAALGVALPQAGANVRRNEPSDLRIVEAGPDDWFVIGPRDRAAAIEDKLRRALAGQHAAVTDVSSGYTVLRLSGAPVRDVLAQGCPLDLHPRAFAAGRCAGTHFFKASVWLWREDGDAFEVLVRRSFIGYVALMLARCTRECGVVPAT